MDTVLRGLDTGTSRDLYFDHRGRRVAASGRAFQRGIVPPEAVYVIRDPFRPSVMSCEQMVREFRRTRRRVVYDKQRWDKDVHVDEQADAAWTGEGFPWSGGRDLAVAA